MLAYAKLAQRRVGFVAGQMELTSKCFQQCVACDSWRADHKGEITGSFSYKEIMHVIGQLNRMPTFEHLSFTGGDPQTWKDEDSGGGVDFERLLYDLNFVRFSLQVNTALVREPKDRELWRRHVRRVRVSLDGATRGVYRMMRGDDRDPEEIVQRMDDLDHPGMSTNTCVTDINIDEVPAIIERLNRMKHPIRKAMFLAAIDFKLRPGFWEKYKALSNIPSPHVELSFQEDVSFVRDFLKTDEAKEIPCYAGAITFHIKCNGELYPCCLVGGEAIKTRREMAIGNVLTQNIEDIQKAYVPALHYANPKAACKEVCQWKQLHLNRLAHEMSKTTLTMP